MAGTSLFDRIFQSDRYSRVAVMYEGRRITYEELRALTVQTAEIVAALRVEKGDRVGILLNDSPECIACFIAVISLGATAVPINMALPRAEQLFILNDCGARAAIVEAAAARSLFAEVDELSASPAEVTSLKDVLVICREAEAVLPSMPGMNVQRIDDAQRNSVSNEIPVRGKENAEAFILYTSGSTGEPKGAVHRQADIFYTNETYCAEVLRLREGDRLFSSSRLPFAYGLGNGLTFPLLNGFTTILSRQKPTAELISTIFKQYLPTIFFGVP